MKKTKKRILYVENGIGYGGAIICLRHLVANLDRSKYEPFVVTSRTGPNYKEIASESKWKYISDCQIDFTKYKETLERNDGINKIPGLKFLLNQLLGRADDVINFLPFFLKLTKIVKNFQPDLIHVNNEPLSNRAAILSGKLMRVPVICHIRGEGDESILIRWLYRLPDHFIPVSRWISKKMERYDVPEPKRSVIYDGITFDKINFGADGQNFRKKFSVKPDDFAVGLIGMLIPWKGQEIFIDAAHILKNKIPNLRMMLIGGAPEKYKAYESMLKQRVRSEKLNDMITFTDHQTNMDEIYNGLDIAVSASTSPEPLGTMVIETMVMGRPLIAPAHGGGAEMTEHGKTGLLFKPGDAKSLSDAVLEYYNRPDLRTFIGRTARQKALQTFSVETHVKGVQAVYVHLFKKGNA